ncbi:hypothetical protein JAAARDRAFT_137147, partial [Jaapia argillacea MUCL 33604]
SPPSIYGALPYPTPISPPLPDTVNFAFTHLEPTILNSTFVNSRQEPVGSVYTDSLRVFTLLKDNDRRSMAMVEWRMDGGPAVEIRGVVKQQRVGKWLPLSDDARSRTMKVNAVSYVWTKKGDYICLCSAADSTSFVITRITKTPTCINLEMSQVAIGLGLLEPCVVAAVLLLCGRKLD